MAALNEILIKPEYRPCFIDLKDGKERKALFHKWIMKEDLFKKQYAMGLVELENGKVLEEKIIIKRKDYVFLNIV